MIKKEPINDAKWRCATGKKEIISHSEFESEVLGKCDELKWKVNCTNRNPIVEDPASLCQISTHIEAPQ